jgi:hypothetical protein
MTLHVDPAAPVLTSAQNLTGWRREFCVEMLGEGAARIFLRAVEMPSMRKPTNCAKPSCSSAWAPVSTIWKVAWRHARASRRSRALGGATEAEQGQPIRGGRHDRGAWDRAVQDASTLAAPPHSGPPRDPAGDLRGRTSPKAKGRVMVAPPSPASRVCAPHPEECHALSPSERQASASHFALESD